MRNITDEAIKALYRHIRENSGSGNAVGIELSETEYEALSEEEKNNGAIYFVYSEDETGNDGNTNPYVIEISQEAYDALPDSEKQSGKLFFVTDYNNENVVTGPEIFNNMTHKGEIQSATLPVSGAEGDFYYLLDKCEGRYFKDGAWKIVR